MSNNFIIKRLDKIMPKFVKKKIKIQIIFYIGLASWFVSKLRNYGGTWYSGQYLPEPIRAYW